MFKSAIGFTSFSAMFNVPKMYALEGLVFHIIESQPTFPAVMSYSSFLKVSQVATKYSTCRSS